MEQQVKTWISHLAVAGEAAAAIIVGLAMLIVLAKVLPRFIARADPAGHPDRILESRLVLGRWLGLALELTLAADILRTAVAPTWDEIGKLAAIATLRTALNYFLEREIRDEQAGPNRSGRSQASDIEFPER